MGVAQLVELLVVVQAVAGSIPVAHPSEKTPQLRGFPFEEAIQTAPKSGSLFRHECLKTARYALIAADWGGFQLAFAGIQS